MGFLDYDEDKKRVFRREELIPIGVLLLFVGVVLVWSNPSPVFMENLVISSLTIIVGVGGIMMAFSSKRIRGVIGKPVSIKFAVLEGIVVFLILSVSYFVFNSSYGSVMVLTSSILFTGLISFLTRIFNIRQSIEGY